MKHLIAISLFLGLHCTFSSSLYAHETKNAWEDKLLPLLQATSDTVFIDLKNDPDFKFANHLRWFQDPDLSLFGIKTQSGDLFIEPLFHQIESFVDNVSIVTFEGYQGAINDKGIVVIPYIYEELQTSSEDRIAFYEGGLWGFFSTTGDKIIPASYEFVGNFSEGLALASKDNLFGYINKQGKVMIPFQYEYASNFENGQAQVEVKFRAFTINKKGMKISN
ncbi:WG repeat-containing protein [Myroides fluvii]|uniref:WG repeat-containing protein n=1 Tax=Myroides fluvii TaxID=2572594 RepID=UPI00131C9648|nr:WG repeat-containing protein [Myroides fluvii]